MTITTFGGLAIVRLAKLKDLWRHTLRAR